MALPKGLDDMNTRAEHLAWCKKRAIEYCDAGDAQNAVASMISDMNKHEETKPVMEIMGMVGLMEIQRGVSAARKWINGFN